MTMAWSVRNSSSAVSWLSRRASDSGVVSRMLGGASFCRLRRLAGVSPVRVSMVMGSAISSTGAVRLRAMSVASAFNGETYKVCSPSRGCWARSTSVGRNPASVLPPPVGAISSALSPAAAASSIAAWNGRSAQPRRANQAANGSGNVPTGER